MNFLTCGGDRKCCFRENNGNIRNELRRVRDDHMKDVVAIAMEVVTDREAKKKIYENSTKDLKGKLMIKSKELGGTIQDVNVVLEEISTS